MPKQHSIFYKLNTTIVFLDLWQMPLSNTATSHIKEFRVLIDFFCKGKYQFIKSSFVVKFLHS
jgi:hypothetical protein